MKLGQEKGLIINIISDISSSIIFNPIICIEIKHESMSN